MAIDENLVQNYVEAKKCVMEHFQCNEDYFVKVLDSYEWIVKENEDFHMLSYWDSNDKRTDAVVVKRNAEPLIFATEEHTMVVAIDCVKIAFVFNNKLEKK